MALINNLPTLEKPREKALQFGVNNLSNTELLAILIRSGTKDHSALEVAKDLLSSCNGLANLACSNVGELTKVKGISKTKAIELQAVFELMRRTTFEEVLGKDVLFNTANIMKWLQLEIGCFKEEKFLVMFLDCQNQLISYKIMSEGTVNQSVVYIREVMKEALIRRATSIVLVHNHPSGNLKPSLEDLSLTSDMKEAGKCIGIQVKDHLIVSAYNAYSICNEEYVNV